MKKCSYCGHENEDSAEAWGGCGQPLATGPATDAAPDLKDPALDPVIVATFENTEHAGILKARLEAAAARRRPSERQLLRSYEGYEEETDLEENSFRSQLSY